MTRILYDTTYCFRGQTGIPGDARSVARILQNLNSNTSFLLKPKTLTKSEIRGNLNQSRLVGDAIRLNSGPRIFPSFFYKSFDLIMSFLDLNQIRISPVNENFRNTIKDLLQIENKSRPSIFLTSKSINRIWARVLLRKPYRLNTKEFDIFIQQHVDPIRVSRNTTHIVRLHDILPITKPEFFNHQAVEIFSKGLNKLLRNNEIVWLMDSEKAATEFKEIFGKNRRVHVIPCAINNNILQQKEVFKKGKQIVCLGTVEPRKRINIAIEAFDLFTTKTGNPENWQLVIAGSKGWQADELYEKLNKGKFSSNIRYVENPSQNEVIQLLGNSAISISGSAAEGFGLPPLEALAMGCRVIASDIDQHKETMKNYAIYFNGTSSDLSMKLIEAINDFESNVKPLQGLKFVIDNYGEARISELWSDFLQTF